MQHCLFSLLSPQVKPWVLPWIARWGKMYSSTLSIVENFHGLF